MSHILALDLSLTATGVCDGPKSTFTIRTSPQDGVLEKRLNMIVDAVDALDALDAFQHPARPLIVIEDYALHGPGDKGKIGMVHGAVRMWLFDSGYKMLFVSPSTLKKFATGKGNANKALMLAEAIKRLGFDGHDDNEVDALWLYALGRHVIGNPIVELPKVHLSALDKLDLSVLEGVTS